MCVLGTITAYNLITTFDGPGGHYAADNTALSMVSVDAAIVRMAQVWEGYEESVSSSSLRKLPLAMRKLALRIMAVSLMDEWTYVEIHEFVIGAEAPLAPIPAVTGN